MPSGARICAKPPSEARRPREPKGLLRQASRITRLSRVPEPCIWRSTRLTSVIWKSTSASRVGLAPTGHEIVGARDLHAVAGIVEQRDVGALHLTAEALHRDVHRALVEIELGAAADQREAEQAQRLRHQARILGGIVERRDVLVGGVADHERDALLGRCRGVR